MRRLLHVSRACELGVGLDEREQTGDWTRRPLTEGQVAHAALDAEVLLQVYDHFEGARPEGEGA